LGKVFENMLAADERGQSGTFYTPRGIVHFMCVESLSRYLADESGVNLEVVKQLAEFDPELPDADLKKLLTKDQTKKLKQALESVKVCDPAVGSGAFPLGMMQVILSVWQAIGQREGESIKRGSLAMSRLKRKIIANNLYGVDIKPEAIEIAKLRMWLSMVVDIPTIDDVEPLPNLDYKLMAGNSLISTIAGEHLIPDPTKTQQGMLNVTPVQAAIQPLLDLQHQYFESHSDDRKDLSKQIREAEANVFRVAIDDRRQYWQGEQGKVEQDIKRMGKASKAQTQKLQTIDDKLKELKTVEIGVTRGMRSLDFFQWHLHFNDVFQQKGGFDVVIGNPPYVNQERIAQNYKDSLKEEFPYLFKGKTDLYTYFYGKGINLLHNSGLLAFISSNKWFRSNYGSKLREHIPQVCQIHSITDFGELPVFDAATFPMIFIAQRSDLAVEKTLFTQVKDLKSPYPNVAEVVRKNGQFLPIDTFKNLDWKIGETEGNSFISRMEVSTTPLVDFVRKKIYVGIKTGLNIAFMIDGMKRKELISKSSRNAEVIKPLLAGDNIRKWRINNEDKWLIHLPWDSKIEEYPDLEEHLSNWKDKLSARPECQDGRHDWWCLSRYGSGYSDAFSQPKIIFPDIAKESRFAFDADGFYVGNTAYIIPVADFYLLGVLNSKAVWKYAQHTFSCLGDPMKGGRFRFIYQSASKIPIPDAPCSERQAISALVQNCLDAKGQNVAEWEAEINDRVAHLYGLTAAEIAQISEQWGKT